MSWDAYVSNLTDSGVVKKAAIYDLQGTVCATSPGFALEDDEFKGLKGSFVKPEDAFADGITIAKTKYMTLRAEADKLYGRKGADGVVVARTSKTFIIGVHDEAHTTQEAAVVVEGLADQIRTSGY